MNRFRDAWQRFVRSEVATGVLFTLVALGSLAVLQWSHMTWRETVTRTTTAMDNLERAKLSLMRAYLIASRSDAGDPTVQLSDAMAELDRASSSIDDWTLGHSVLLGIDGTPLPRGDLLHLAMQYDSLIVSFRAVIATPGPAGAVDRRIAFAALDRSSNAIEQRLYGDLRATLAAQERNHLLLLGAWVVFLLALGATSRAVVVARSRAEARLRELDAQLRQAQKMEALGQLTGGIAHDFRNILTVVMTTSESLLDTVPAGMSEMRRELEEIRAAANRGADITRKLLAFSRLEQLDLRPVRLADVADEVSGVLRRLIDQRVKLDLALRERELIVRGDPGALHHILINLATNARDAMPDGGVLRIELEGPAAAARLLPAGTRPHACLSVRDTGVGMDEHTRSRIFEPFYTTKPAGKGTGLGLSMVHGLVQEQGGMIRVESRPGAGTTFYLLLPLTEQQVDTAPAVADPQPATLGPAEPAVSGPGTELPAASTGASRLETILIAEDEAPLRRVAQRALERLGYTVLLAADGAEAMQVLEAHRDEIDLVISDSAMPNVGGLEFYANTRRAGINVRFLIASGHVPGAGDTREEAATGHAVPFLPKPWSLSALAAKVREVLDAPVAA